MAVFKRGGVCWYEFTFAGKRIRESAKTSRRTIALEAEKARRLELERALSGLPAAEPGARISRVSEAVKAYLRHYASNHRKKSLVFAQQRLKHITRYFGTALFIDINETRIKDYIAFRLSEEVGGRTINMELGELSRVMGHTWRELWPKVRKLEENSNVGRALMPNEERRLLQAAATDDSPNRNPMLYSFLKLALSTGMRSGEIADLQWERIDFKHGMLTVGKAKSEAGSGRQIPMNADLRATLETHMCWYVEKMRELGHKTVDPSWYVFPGKVGRPKAATARPLDPTRPITTIKSAWDSLRLKAGVSCRLHDLRHTAATKMAEAGVTESTMKAILGHMSRAMLERYSHIRMAAKREAVECLSLPAHQQEEAESSVGVPTKAPTVEQSELVH